MFDADGKFIRGWWLALGAESSEIPGVAEFPVR